MRQTLVSIILSTILSTTTLALPSAELRDIWDIPLNIVNFEIAKDYLTDDNIKVEEIYYYSREYQGKPAKIFGYFCYPAGEEHPLPAILVVHGGGGGADRTSTINWARRGYAVLAIDLPGKGLRRDNSQSTGPNMSVAALLRTSPHPRYNYLVHAVAAARSAISLLSQREMVDPDRIGMVGVSWGGVITLLTNGQDTRLKTAVNVFGAGYIPEGSTWQTRFNTKSPKELDEWNQFIDPKNFLSGQKASILFVTGTNDHCYYLPIFQKSYGQVTTQKQIYLVPNLKHLFLASDQAVVGRWLDIKLKNEKGQDFPEISILPAQKTDKKTIIPVTASSSSKIAKISLYYTEGKPQGFTKKVWQEVTGHYFEDIYYFALPNNVIDHEIMFFATAYDETGAASSTPVRSLSKSLTISGPIHEIKWDKEETKMVLRKEEAKQAVYE